MRPTLAFVAIFDIRFVVNFREAIGGINGLGEVLEFISGVLTLVF